MRYSITIDKQKNDYRAIIKATGQAARIVDDLQLHAHNQISVKNEFIDLGIIVTALQQYKLDWLQHWFDEVGQLALGRYLYQQLFAEQQPELQAELFIISDDEHINRLPWTLLAYKHQFLGLSGWSIVLSSGAELKNSKLPLAPRLLIIAPEPENRTVTRATEHLNALENSLIAKDAGLKPRIVSTWSGFCKALQEQEYELLYYYGHGISDGFSSALLFANESNQALEIPVIDLVNLLKKQAIQLAYFNCCFGDAGGLLGIGKQLGDFIPAVLTNRTAAIIDTAQAQALHFWQQLLVENTAPHQALSKQAEYLTHLDLSLADIRWITPVLHRHYQQWSMDSVAEASDWKKRDPHWQYRLDRANQMGRVYLKTQDMLRNQRPKALAYLWYGLPNQGVDRFHQRLNVEFTQNLANVQLFEVKPTWSTFTDAADDDFANMLAQAFDIAQWDDFESKLRQLTRYNQSSQTLVYIRHQPIDFDFTDNTLFHPNQLTLYLHWWNQYCVKRLPPSCYVLLGISYHVTEPTRFYEGLKKRGLNDIDLSDSVFHILDELTQVTEQDLIDFIKEQRIDLLPDIKREKLEQILKDTKGDYDKVLSELQNIERSVWRKKSPTTTQDDW